MALPTDILPLVVPNHQGCQITFTQNQNADKTYYSHLIRWLRTGEAQYRIAGVLAEVFKKLALVFSFVAKSSGSDLEKIGGVFGVYSKMTIFGHGVSMIDALVNPKEKTEVAVRALSISEQIAIYVKRIGDAIIPAMYMAMDFAPHLKWGTLAGFGTLVFCDLPEAYTGACELQRIKAVLGNGPADALRNVSIFQRKAEDERGENSFKIENITGEQLNAVNAKAEESLKQAKTLQMIRLSKVICAVAAGILLVATILTTPVAATGAAVIAVSAKTTAAIKFGAGAMSFLSPIIAMIAYLYKESMQFHVEIQPVPAKLKH